MGKYDALIPRLPKGQPEDLNYQAKVQRFKDTVTDRSTLALATQYIKARTVIEDIKAELYMMNVELAALEQLLEESQQNGAELWGLYGVKENALRLPDGSTIRVQLEPYGQVQDKERFRLWCIYNGYERQMHIWPSTMNAIVKERLVQGEPEPDGCTAFVKTKVVYVPKGGASE